MIDSGCRFHFVHWALINFALFLTFQTHSGSFFLFFYYNYLDLAKSYHFVSAETFLKIGSENIFLYILERLFGGEKMVRLDFIEKMEIIA